VSKITAIKSSERTPVAGDCGKSERYIWVWDYHRHCWQLAHWIDPDRENYLWMPYDALPDIAENKVYTGAEYQSLHTEGDDTVIVRPLAWEFHYKSKAAILKKGGCELGISFEDIEKLYKYVQAAKPEPEAGAGKHVIINKPGHKYKDYINLYRNEFRVL